jgi:hypothetical protein
VSTPGGPHDSWGGALILFLVYHILHFTVILAHRALWRATHAERRHRFRNPFVVILYLWP